MVEYFFNKEIEYEQWCKENPNGYVFNNAKGETGNVLHSVGCWHLNVPSRRGTYTTRYPKYCSNDLKKIVDEANNKSKPDGWRTCAACMGK